MYSAVTEIAKTALIATSPANANKPSRSAKTASKMTVFTGVWVKEFIRYNHEEKGSAK